MKYFIPDSILKDIQRGTFIDALQGHGGWYDIARDEIHCGWVVKTNQDVDYILREVTHGNSLKVSD